MSIMRDYFQGRPNDFYRVIGISSLLLIAGLTVFQGMSSLDRRKRQERIDDYYNTAQAVREEYFKGFTDLAKEHQKNLWERINREKNLYIGEPGNLRASEMGHLTTNLHSTNVFSKGNLVKPVVK